MENMLRKVKNLGGGGDSGLNRSQEVRRSRSQASLNTVILNLFQDLVFGCKEVNGYRSKVCNVNTFLPLLGKDKRMGDNQYPPLPSLIREGIQAFPLRPSLNKKRKSAFTLAEVLITLGVIGVVAALTMPTLIVKHQKQVFVNRVKQTYSIVSNAMISAVAEYGEPNTWDAFSIFDTSDPNYNQNHQEHMKNVATKYFKPYLKVIGEGQRGFQYYMVLSNGVTLTFYPDGSYNADKTEFNQTQVYIIGSLNNNSSYFLDESRDYSRRDFLMSFNVSSTDYRLKFFNTDEGKTRNEYKNDGQYGCNKDVPKNKRLYCGSMLFYDNWQLKDDYPW